jgi:GTPase SAR1 family protein
LVYNITNRQTFDEIKKFKEQIDIVKDMQKYPLVLCGNKIDLEYIRVVDTWEGRLMANKFGCPFYECSAKKRINIDEVWFQLVREINKYYDRMTKSKRKMKRKTKCLIL